jgi:dolichol-phosphate mannosyltransferase
MRAAPCPATVAAGGPDGAVPPGPALDLRATSVTLVLPTYNERDNIVPMLDGARAALAASPAIAAEIVVVDDDSPDGTGGLAAAYARACPEVRLLRRRGTRGLSGAVVDGFAHGRGAVLAVMDADLSHDVRVLPELIAAVVSGADVAVASRRLPGGGADAWPWHRRRTSDLATALARWYLGVPLTDPMSGYFALRRDVFDRVRAALRPQGYKILLEIVCRAGPLRIVELPYVFRDRHQGISKLTPLVALQFLASLRELRRQRHSPSPAPAR